MALPRSSGEVAGGFGGVLVRFWEVWTTSRSALGGVDASAGADFQVPYMVVWKVESSRELQRIALRGVGLGTPYAQGAVPDFM